MLLPSLPALPGTTTWQYNISDGVQSAVGWVTLTAPPGDPTAVADAFTCTFDAACAFSAAAGLLANDASPNNGKILSVVPGSVAPLQPLNGGLIAFDAAGAFNYTPPR
jgi:hypothetical protein